ncbi:hypothetical protein EDB81DRAFT_3978 [Dactylonectria macrodidyma]|uniref:Uncharacterized protein n=1 Tax=Dactylonectria macrodidyma TaxID=307937 RepID=A0A9P9FRM9_9HYPO|nr:hypothetical protein EDB81DRAFT_3978 [Dactylonectria macrodidyma]
MSDNTGGPRGPRDLPERPKKEKTPRPSRQEPPRETRRETPGASESARAIVRTADRDNDKMKNDIQSLCVMANQLRKDVDKIRHENNLRDENAIIRNYNARAVARLKPLLSYETGQAVRHAPAAASDIKSMSAEQADIMLKHVGLSVASDDVKEKRRTLMLAYGVTHLPV